MSKREVWHRIDYDPTPKPIIISRTTQSSGGLTREDVQEMIDQYIEIQYVDNLADVNLFRSVQGAYKGSSANFRVPLSAEAGDLLLLFGSAQYNSHTAEPQLSGSHNREEMDSTGAINETSGDPSSFGAVCATTFYVIESGDIGATLTYTWDDTDYDDQITFFILLENDAFDRLGLPDSYGIDYRYRFELEGSNTALDALTFYAASILGYGSNTGAMPTPPDGATTMIDLTNGQNRLWVLFRLRNSFDVLPDYVWSAEVNSVTAMVDIVRA